MYSEKIESKYKRFLQEKEFKNVICKMLAILFQPRGVNSLQLSNAI